MGAGDHGEGAVVTFRRFPDVRFHALPVAPVDGLPGIIRCTLNMTLLQMKRQLELWEVENEKL